MAGSATARLAGLLAAMAAAAGAEEPEPVAPSITEMTFSKGSPLGNQRLALTGSGFTTNFHDGANTVEIGNDSKGWATCRVVEGACTVDCGSANRIVCDTEQVPDSWLPDDGDLANVDTGPLDVKVNVCRGGCDGGVPDMVEVRTGPFEFTSARNSRSNPTLLGVEPRHLSADMGISLTGSREFHHLF